MSGPDGSAGRASDRVRRSPAGQIWGVWEGFPGGGVIYVAKRKWVEGASEVEGAAIAKALRQDTWFISRAAGSKVGSRERQGREVTEHSPCWACGLQGGFGQCQDWKPLTCADP